MMKMMMMMMMMMVMVFLLMIKTRIRIKEITILLDRLSNPFLWRYPPDFSFSPSIIFFCFHLMTFDIPESGITRDCNELREKFLHQKIDPIEALPKKWR